MNKINYGIDAPTIMKNLLGFGAFNLITGMLVNSLFNRSVINYLSILVAIGGGIFFLLGVAMLAYGLKGKYRIRDLMLSKINWKGDEMVLDIGTGQGLLMNGAAKKLKSGKSIGIDIWSQKDLSDNTISRTQSNAVLEGVADKIEIREEDAINLSFENNSFDLVFSLLCIHNIEPKANQEKALLEIARVLKPNGIAIIGDYIPTDGYAKILEKAGLEITSNQTYFSKALALMWILEVKKIA